MKRQHKLTENKVPKEIQREKKRKKKTPKRKEERMLKKNLRKTENGTTMNLEEKCGSSKISKRRK
jgi:glycine cleavage system pyridoxal-binding protein P